MMRWKSRSALAGVLFALAGHSLALEPPYYRPVYCGDVLAGYVRDGDSVEIEAHAWINDAGMSFNADYISARVPMRIDVANFSDDTIRRLKADCGAKDQFLGGCRVILRGQPVHRGDRQVFVGIEVEIKSRR